MSNQDALISNGNHPTSTEEDELKCVRDEFARTVGRTIVRVMEENGYNRDRATNLILREVGDTTAAHQCEDELNRVKQHYRLTHQQAVRAFAVSKAIRRLTRDGDKSSYVDAVRLLTEKLSNATFNHVENTEPRELSSGETALTAVGKKPSEIHIPDIPKQHQLSVAAERRPKSPPKRTKPTTSSTSKAIKGKPPLAKLSRKRSLEDLGSVSTQQSSSEQSGTGETRHRSDSVTEAVSAKMSQNDSTIVNSEKQSSRAKRRATGSLDESDVGAVAKRGRSTTA
ncbi:hypothetical protein ACA910_007962 [Epithemia clementina (nom. ined.)]